MQIKMLNFEKIVKPVFYCDVDGVLNLRKHSAPKSLVKKIVWKKYSLQNGSGVPMFHLLKYDPIVVEEISQLPVELVWLSAWNKYARTILEPLTSLVSTRVLEYRLTMKDLRTEKGKYVLLVADQKQNPSPFIWVDNVATKNFVPADWVNHPYPYLVITPHSHYGLTVKHIEEIKFFLKNLQVRENVDN